MIFTTVLLALMAHSLLLVQGAPTAAEAKVNKKCYTVEKGYLTAIPKYKHKVWKHVPFGLAKDKHVTFGTKDPKLAVEFQSCPEIPNQLPDYRKWYGRITVPSLGKEQCLTVYGKPDHYKIKVSKCSSTTKPPKSQLWEYGNDFGDVVYWYGSKDDLETGYKALEDLVPITEGKEHQAILGCATECVSMNITPKSKLNDPLEQ